jgi:hypothetical protein
MRVEVFVVAGPERDADEEPLVCTFERTVLSLKRSNAA